MLKIRFMETAMARRAIKEGLKILSQSIPSYLIAQEIFTSIVPCYNCFSYQHKTNTCPLPRKTMCTSCAQEGHKYLECPSQTKQCINCGGPHNTLANACPIRKGLSRNKAKEQLDQQKMQDKLRRQQHHQAQKPTHATSTTTTGTSYAGVTAGGPFPPQPSINQQAVAMNLRDQQPNLTVLRYAIAMGTDCESITPGTFKEVVELVLRINGMPKIKIPTWQELQKATGGKLQNPPKTTIQNTTEVMTPSTEETAQATRAKETKKTQADKNKEETQKTTKPPTTQTDCVTIEEITPSRQKPTKPVEKTGTEITDSMEVSEETSKRAREELEEEEEEGEQSQTDETPGKFVPSESKKQRKKRKQRERQTQQKRDEEEEKQDNQEQKNDQQGRQQQQKIHYGTLPQEEDITALRKEIERIQNLIERGPEVTGQQQARGDGEWEGSGEELSLPKPLRDISQTHGTSCLSPLSGITDPAELSVDSDKEEDIWPKTSTPIPEKLNKEFITNNDVTIVINQEFGRKPAGSKEKRAAISDYYRSIHKVQWTNRNLSKQRLDLALKKGEIDPDWLRFEVVTREVFSKMKNGHRDDDTTYRKK